MEYFFVNGKDQNVVSLLYSLGTILFTLILSQAERSNTAPSSLLGSIKIIMVAFYVEPRLRRQPVSHEKYRPIHCGLVCMN